MIKISKQRKKQREVTGSPEFQINSGSIGSSNSWIVDLGEIAPEGGTSGQMKKWLPFDEFTIRNSSANEIKFYRNQNKRFLRTISGNQVVTITDKALRSFKIVASGGAISSDEITINVTRTGMDSDSLSKHVALNPLVRQLLGV